MENVAGDEERQASFTEKVSSLRQLRELWCSDLMPGDISLGFMGFAERLMIWKHVVAVLQLNTIYKSKGLAHRPELVRWLQGIKARLKQIRSISVCLVISASPTFSVGKESQYLPWG